MMRKKIISELIIHTHANQVLEEQKGEEPTKSISRVLAKEPPKVKSLIEESPITQKVWSFHIPWRREDLVLI